MECQLCRKRVFCLNPYWVENRKIECCCDCAKKHNLKGVNIEVFGSGFEKILRW